MFKLFCKKTSKQIAKVISKYMKIDTKSMEIQITKTSVKGKIMKNPILYANIPIIDMKN